MTVVNNYHADLVIEASSEEEAKDLAVQKAENDEIDWIPNEEQPDPYDYEIGNIEAEDASEVVDDQDNG